MQIWRNGDNTVPCEQERVESRVEREIGEQDNVVVGQINGILFLAAVVSRLVSIGQQPATHASNSQILNGRDSVSCSCRDDKKSHASTLALCVGLSPSGKIKKPV